MPLDAAWPTTGKLRYELKKAWRDGTRFVVFEPHELLARVCAMIPPPRFHMIRFHGVLAPNAALRRHVVGSLRPSALAMEPAPATFTTPGIEQPSLFGQMEAPSGFDAARCAASRGRGFCGMCLRLT
ncbi:transposase [Polyangium jinanense]|uniref:Transposase n=1 Tax=Polyangium jinanense TaxID=2829994 RepID=A0A9X3X6L0_9BACT|nr:transposase [Polyangium jinanense]